MQILKAYADAGANGSHGYGFSPAHSREENPAKAKQSTSGDSISLSTEAKAMLENGDSGYLNIDHNDATYDQYGNVNRQFDSLRGGLRQLATHFMGTPGGAGMAGKLRMMQSQLAGIEARV